MNLNVNSVLQIIAFALFPIYNAWFLYRYDQTLGKGAMKIKVLNKVETHIGFWQALSREIIVLIELDLYLIIKMLRFSIPNKVLLMIVVGIQIILFTILITNKKRKAVHDFIANTVVVKVE
jgi:uncharacterized RDD family membrane protein YckC